MGRNRVGVESDKNGKEQKEDETEVRQVEEESIEEETDPRDDGSSFSTSSFSFLKIPLHWKLYDCESIGLDSNSNFYDWT